MSTTTPETSGDICEELKAKIAQRSAKIGVVGLGYVGLPLLHAFIEAGFSTVGFDVDEKKVDSLNQGDSYIAHIPSEWIQRWRKDRRFDATTDMARLQEADAVLICVPTPLTSSRDPDLAYVESTVRQIANTLRRGQLIVLESTTYPGTTRDVILPALTKNGAECGRDFFLAYSPEREDPGNPSYSARGIPKVVGGMDERSLEVARALYDCRHKIVKS